jgi:hypothetical protein
MSAADKTKLDGIAPGAAVVAVTGTPPIIIGGTAGHPDVEITLASTIASGAMSAADKSKLNGISPNATNTPLATTAPATVGTANTIGVGTTAARDDHVHAHGAQTDTTLHAVAVGGNPGSNGFISGPSQLKVDKIGSSATNNATAATNTNNTTGAFSAIPGCSVSVTIVAGGKVRVTLSGTCSNSNLNQGTFVAIDDGAGTLLSPVQKTESTVASLATTFSISILVGGLAAGAHTFRGVWKPTGATSRIDMLNNATSGEFATIVAEAVN